MKRDIYIWKENYTRKTYIYEKRPRCKWKETHIYMKRVLYIWKETYLLFLSWLLRFFTCQSSRLMSIIAGRSPCWGGMENMSEMPSKKRPMNIEKRPKKETYVYEKRLIAHTWSTPNMSLFFFCRSIWKETYCSNLKYTKHVTFFYFSLKKDVIFFCSTNSIWLFFKWHWQQSTILS